MKTRRIHSKIWTDSWFCSLSRASSFLFIYLITNEYIGFSGYAEIPDRVICFQSGLTQKELEQCKKELYPKVRFFGDWVLVVNLQRYDPIKGEENKLWTAYKKELETVPDVVKRSMDAPLMPHPSPIDGVNGKGNSINIYNKGGVGGKEKSKYGSINDLTDEHCKKIADHYKVSPGSVFDLREDMKLYCASTGKKYINYSATLQRWLRKRIAEGNYVSSTKN